MKNKAYFYTMKTDFETEEVFSKLNSAGMNVVKLNCSGRSNREISKIIKLLRKINKHATSPTIILLENEDLSNTYSVYEDVAKEKEYLSVISRHGGKNLFTNWFMRVNNVLRVLWDDVCNVIARIAAGILSVFGIKGSEKYIVIRCNSKRRKYKLPEATPNIITNASTYELYEKIS